MERKQVGLSLESEHLNKTKEYTGQKQFLRELRHFIHSHLPDATLEDLQEVKKVNDTIVKPLRFPIETLDIIDAHVNSFTGNGHNWVNRSVYMRYVIRQFYPYIKQKNKKDSEQIELKYALNSVDIAVINHFTTNTDFSHVVDQFIRNDYKPSPHILSSQNNDTSIKKLYLSKESHSILKQVAADYSTHISKVIVHVTSQLANSFSSTSSYNDITLTYRLKEVIKESKERYGDKATMEKVTEYLSSIQND